MNTACKGNPIIIVGVGRSGTSLLHSMLAAHPEVSFPPETGFMRRFVVRGELRRIYRRGGREAVTRRLDADERFQRLGLKASDLVELAARGRSLTDAALYQCLLRQYARDQGKPRFGDKDPRLIEHLMPLKSVFPAAWVVHVIRDPRDVLLSKKKAEWSRTKPVLRHVFANRVQFKMGRVAAHLFGDGYVELFYEELLADAEATLRRLCRAVSLPYDPTMLDFEDAAARLVSVTEMSWKSQTLGPLLKKNAGKWRDGLSGWEVALVEQSCTDALHIGDYAISHAVRNLGWFRRLGVSLTTLLFVIADPVYRGIRRVLNSRADS